MKPRAKPALQSVDLTLPTLSGLSSILIALSKSMPGTATVKNAYQMLGKIEQRLFVVVYTPRHDTIRIISARKANQREVKHYENSTRDN